MDRGKKYVYLIVKNRYIFAIGEFENKDIALEAVKALNTRKNGFKVIKIPKERGFERENGKNNYY